MNPRTHPEPLPPEPPEPFPLEGVAPLGSPSIGQQAARGAAWLMAQSVADRLLNLLSQIVLARLLVPEQFTHVALVYTITTFATLVQQAGLSQVLVQRHGKLRVWENAVFWMSLTIGLCAGVFTAIAAPVAAWFYHDPALLALILIASLSMPINALATVPDASLRGHMKFKALSAIALAFTLTTVALSIALAALGFGASAIIIPQVVGTAIRVALLWWVERPRTRRSPQLRRWKYLISDSARLVLTQFALMSTYQGGQGVLGRLYPQAPPAGVYLFSWNVSDQPLRLLVNNLAGVLFPALRTMQDDPARQVAAYLRATRLLLIIGLPVCFLQAVLADPVIRLVFRERWVAAIPVMSAISIGMSARLVFGPSESMFLAQRRTGTYLALSIAYAIAFFSLVIPGARLGGIEHGAAGAAIAAGIVLTVLGPISMRLAIAPAGGRWRDVARVYAAPIAASAIAFAPAWFLPRLFEPTLAGEIGAIVAIGTLSSAVYLLVIFLTARRDLREILDRVRTILRRNPRATSS
jgi:PST family polysaccharide transporter